MFSRLICTLSLGLIISTGTYAGDDLLQQAKNENQREQRHNQAREATFNQSLQTLRSEKAALLARKKTLQAEADRFAARFSQNEERLARQEEALRLETGSLGELFGVVRQSAKQLQLQLENSVTGSDRQQHVEVVNQIIAAKTLPSLTQLNGLWQAMQEQITASGEIARQQVSLIDGDGRQHSVTAFRLGALAMVTEQGYVAWNNQDKTATSYPRQPDNGATYSSLQAVSEGATQSVVLDPSAGGLLEQLALTPTLSERLQAGGVIGHIILLLLAVGLLIALYRGAMLTMARGKIRAQLKQPAQPGDNPLGRVLAVYDKTQQRSVEALELRLLETIVDEQAGLEQGLSMLKLLAALAPMLGLLGTVTGMIETFQVITQFGNGDPKVMAGGISMALITTVLGLIAAMPLLLAHNLLQTQAENIRQILEKQGIALVAEQAERECDTKPSSLAVGSAA